TVRPTPRRATAVAPEGPTTPLWNARFPSAVTVTSIEPLAKSVIPTPPLLPGIGYRGRTPILPQTRVTSGAISLVNARDAAMATSTPPSRAARDRTNTATPRLVTPSGLVTTNGTPFPSPKLHF